MELDRLAEVKDKVKKLQREGEQQKKEIRELHEQLRVCLEAKEQNEKSGKPGEPKAEGGLNSKSQRLYREAADQHMVYLASRQELAVTLFEQLGVNFKRLLIRDALDHWVKEVQVRTVEILGKEQQLSDWVAPRP